MDNLKPGWKWVSSDSESNRTAYQKMTTSDWTSHLSNVTRRVDLIERWALTALSLSVPAAGWATRRRVTEASSTCWRRASTTTGGCGAAATQSCAPSEWSRRCVATESLFELPESQSRMPPAGSGWEQRGCKRCSPFPEPTDNFCAV